MTAEAAPDNLRGGAWVIADMSLNIWALSIVKAMGAGYPATQVVFLRSAPPLVLMTFYTAGLTAATAVPAMLHRHPVAAGHLLPLLLIGVFAQAAQLCFLRAHFLGAAGFLSVLGYLSLLVSVGVGLLVLDEVPHPAFRPGAALVVGAGERHERLRI